MSAEEGSRPLSTEPLPMTRILLEKVWGGRAFETTPGFQLDSPGPIGESWELVDRDERSSVVASGPFRGRTLRGLMLSEPETILGDAVPAPGGYFPVLLKYLNATEPLSVQVHPSSESAGRIGAGAQGKTEAWYLLEAAPSSVIYLGLEEAVDAARFAAVAESADVVELLQSWRASAGQFYFVSAGTVHAIGAGVTLVEVQENSDTTYRIYDWGRKGLDGAPRETHVDKALLCTEFEPSAGPLEPQLTDYSDGCRWAPLVECPQFAMDLFDVDSKAALDTDRVAVAYMVLSGSGRLAVPGTEASYELSAGATWLLPAGVGAHVLDATKAEGLRVMRVRTRAG